MNIKLKFSYILDPAMLWVFVCSLWFSPSKYFDSFKHVAVNKLNFQSKQFEICVRGKKKPVQCFFYSSVFGFSLAAKASFDFQLNFWQKRKSKTLSTYRNANTIDRIFDDFQLSSGQIRSFHPDKSRNRDFGNFSRRRFKFSYVWNICNSSKYITYAFSQPHGSMDSRPVIVHFSLALYSRKKIQVWNVSLVISRAHRIFSFKRIRLHLLW